MRQTNTLARTMHDLGLAAWFGGTLMGALGLNGASAEVSDPRQRARVANAGWKRWTPANLAAIGAYVVGGSVLTGANRGRLVAQRGEATRSAVKATLTGLTLVATAYSRALGQKVISAGDVPVEDGTTPNSETPEDVAEAQRRLKVLQWAIPAHVAALIVMSSRQGEQQRPQAVVEGIRRRLKRAA